MAELAAVREPEWLKERRSDAARRAAELDLPRFKGKAGWEFTDISKLDLAAFTAAAPGEGDASAVDRVETLLEAPEGRAPPRAGRRPRDRRRRRSRRPARSCR